MVQREKESAMREKAGRRTMMYSRRRAICKGAEGEGMSPGKVPPAERTGRRSEESSC